VAIKWPNDIWAAGLKVCGMLIDGEAGPGGLVALPGIGINVNGDPPAIHELRGIATSIRNLTGAAVPREPLLARICNGLEAFLDGDPEALSAAYRAMSMVVGARIRLAYGDGREREGVAVAVADSGALMVRFDDGTRDEVTAAEVSLRPA
jgi:BirA family biotin operon repressor/biotin-[acetyl-CoA-carboxylase] ligase